MQWILSSADESIINGSLTSADLILELLSGDT